MFYLSVIEHNVRLPPRLLGRNLEKSIIGELENIFVDKVIRNLGLCISVYDIKKIDGGFINQGEGGAPTYTVTFRLIMFRPFMGEILAAKVKEIDNQGLRLSLEFYDDIYVPAYFFYDKSDFEPAPENRWICQLDGDPYPIEQTDEEIRFQVHSVDYPPIPLDLPEESKPFAPMVVTGKLNHYGLGPVAWWKGWELQTNPENAEQQPGK